MSEEKLEALSREIAKIKIRLALVESQLGIKSTQTRAKSSRSKSEKSEEPKITPKTRKQIAAF